MERNSNIKDSDNSSINDYGKDNIRDSNSNRNIKATKIMDKNDNNNNNDNDNNLTSLIPLNVFLLHAWLYLNNCCFSLNPVIFSIHRDQDMKDLSVSW